MKFWVHWRHPTGQPWQTDPMGVKPLLQLAWQTVPCKRRGEMQLLQLVAEVHCWQPVAQGTHWPAELMKFLVAHTHLLSTVLVKELRQVVQVLESTQLEQ